jgi:hypothetical protein
MPGTTLHRLPLGHGFTFIVLSYEYSRILRLDQIVRLELLEAFRDEDLQIVTSCGRTSLVSRAGRPNRSVASDHLPIAFSLDL